MCSKSNWIISNVNLLICFCGSTPILHAIRTLTYIFSSVFEIQAPHNLNYRATDRYHAGILVLLMNRHAFVIRDVRVDGSVSGRQRKQGKKPADNADHGVENKTTFDRLGRRAGQMGWQNTFVELTPYTNWPFARGLRWTIACHFCSSLSNDRSRWADVEEMSLYGLCIMVEWRGMEVHRG